MEAGQGRGPRPASSTSSCARSPRACAWSPCCCTRTCPRPPSGCWTRSGRTAASRSTRRASARGRAAPRVDDAGPPLFPKQHVIDSHTHLDRCRGRRRARRRGRARRACTRILTVGMDAASCRAALAAAEAHARSSPPSAATRTSPRATTTPSWPSCASSPATRGCAAIGETGLDYYRDYAPRADQERAFYAQIGARARDGQAARHPHARGRGRHDRDAGREHAQGLDGDPALLLDARPARRVPGARLVDLLRRQRHLPEGAGPRATRPRACPLERLLVETDAPYLTPAGRAQGAQPARPTSSTRRASSPSAAGVAYEELEAAVEPNAAEVFGW